MLQPQSGQYVEEVLERMADAYYEVDGEWTITYWNGAMEARTGYAGESVVGCSLWEVFPMLVNTEFEENYRRAMATRAPVSFESDIPEANYLVVVSVYPTDEGLGIYSNETTAQREQERRLAAAFDNRFHHTALLRPTGLLLEASDMLLDVMGVEAEDVLGHTLEELDLSSAWTDAHATLLGLLTIAATGERACGEFTVDGRIFDVSLNPIESDSGDVVYVVLEYRDITELRAARRELDQLFELSVDPLCLAGFDGYFKSLNPAWERVLGWSTEELLARPWLDYVHPDDIEATIAAGETLVDGEQVVAFENRYRCADGGYRWLSWSAVPLPEEEVLVCVVRDVTDQKEQRAELERERDLFHRVQQMAHIGAWEFDLTTSEVMWTDEVYAIHGLSPETFTPTLETVIEFYHPEDRPVIEAAVKRGVALGEGWDVELRLVTAMGEVIWVQARGDVYYRDGEPTTIRGTFQDITDRREREQRRQESEEQLRLVIDSIPQFVWLKNREGRYLLANEAIAVTYSTTPAELEGSTDAEFAVANVDRDFRADDRAVIDSGERVTFVEQVVDSAGDERTVQTQLLPFESVATGERLLLGITADITERERTARELATSERYLRELYEISASSVPLKEKISALLATGCERFGLDLGLLAHIEDDTYTVMSGHSTGDAIPEGTQFDLKETFCEVTVAADDVVSFEQASCGIECSHPAYEKFGVEAYIGVNVVVDGEPYGTVNFSSSAPREKPFSENERVYVNLLAEWLAYELEGDRASRELEQRRAQLREIIDAVPHPIYVKSHDGTYQLVNRATAAFLGRSIAELEGQPESAFLSAEECEHIAQNDASIIETGKSLYLGLETVTDTTGKMRMFQSRKVPLTDFETGETLVLGVSVDVTELKRSEEALQVANEELELRYSQLEFFDSLMRHDVLNALTVIRANGEFIRESAADDQTRQDAETIVEWSDDIVLLINRVRHIIDVLTGDTAPASPVEVAPLVEAELSRLAAAYPTVGFETAVDDVAVLAGDLLGEVVGNLLANAVVHNDAERPHVAVEVVADEETVTLVVADDGPGVADDRKATVFRRGETSHVKHSGSGFGLFFVDMMVAAYGGTVHVEDNDPCGARFVLELPRHTEEAETNKFNESNKPSNFNSVSKSNEPTETGETTATNTTETLQQRTVGRSNR